ncbi:MAG: hypothetical protein WBP64_06520 [Nitrososphaeraceae archaeon]|jgi:hypothetical protein
MPEIWLKYGHTYIVLDIRFENLLKHISSNLDLLTDDKIRDILSRVKLDSSTLILLLDSSKSVAKVVDTILDLNKSIDLSKISIQTFSRCLEVLRANISNKDFIIDRIDSEPLGEKFKKFQRVLMISHTKYDPLFGFSGAPTTLLRNYNPDKMTKAYNSRVTNLPTPGVVGPPLDVALSAFSDMRTECIEVIANSCGISAIYYDDVVKAFNNAIGHLSSIIVSDEIRTSSAIISASDEEGPHQTLSCSLNSLWNSIHLVKKNGSAVLLAENIQGLGSGVLRDFVEGRIEAESALNGLSYVEGLEHLLYLRELKLHYDLGILSTLPQYYLNMKLGLIPYSGSKEVLDRLIAKHGKNHKILIISDADIIFVKSEFDTNA